ncbi:MAG: SHOCT domain-containing protein [Deltaproteobacteria bacterium]|nr:SHOCT domain-containing protein [Deltaproteobacteria bacterium]
MNKKIATLIVLAGLTFVPTVSHANKTTYIYTDRKFHFVKRVELGKGDLEERQLNQPYSFNDFQMREILAGVKFNRELFLSKEVEEKEVFNQANLDFLVPYLVQAFKDAKPNEEVVFAFITSKPKFLVRDDRLTIVRSWVEGNTLHLNFRKLMAKVSSNWDKFSDVSQAMNRAQGLRVSLDLGEGQQYGKNRDEVLLNIPDSSALATASATVTPAAQEPAVADSKDSKNKVKKTTAAPTETATATPALPSPADNNLEERLQQLDNLKKKGLVNKDEYNQKKKEILNQL